MQVTRISKLKLLIRQLLPSSCPLTTDADHIAFHLRSWWLFLPRISFTGYLAESCASLPTAQHKPSSPLSVCRNLFTCSAPIKTIALFQCSSPPVRMITKGSIVAIRPSFCVLGVYHLLAFTEFIYDKLSQHPLRHSTPSRPGVRDALRSVRERDCLGHRHRDGQRGGNHIRRSRDGHPQFLCHRSSA